MQINEQIKALAELDGWINTNSEYSHLGHPEYLTSYDTIIPLIQKLGKVGAVSVHVCTWGQCTYTMNATPSQFCKALLRATGKWKE